MVLHRSRQPNHRHALGTTRVYREVCEDGIHGVETCVAATFHEHPSWVLPLPGGDIETAAPTTMGPRETQGGQNSASKSPSDEPHSRGLKNRNYNARWPLDPAPLVIDHITHVHAHAGEGDPARGRLYAR
jgi:hypothetical protein